MKVTPGEDKGQRYGPKFLSKFEILFRKTSIALEVRRGNSCTYSDQPCVTNSYEEHKAYLDMDGSTPTTRDSSQAIPQYRGTVLGDERESGLGEEEEESSLPGMVLVTS